MEALPQGSTSYSHDQMTFSYRKAFNFSFCKYVFKIRADRFFDPPCFVLPFVFFVHSNILNFLLSSMFVAVLFLFDFFLFALFYFDFFFLLFFSLTFSFCFFLFDFFFLLFLLSLCFHSCIFFMRTFCKKITRQGR